MHMYAYIHILYTRLPGTGNREHIKTRSMHVFRHLFQPNIPKNNHHTDTHPDKKRKAPTFSGSRSRAITFLHTHANCIALPPAPQNPSIATLSTKPLAATRLLPLVLDFFPANLAACLRAIASGVTEYQLSLSSMMPSSYLMCVHTYIRTYIRTYNRHGRDGVPALSV